MEQRDHAVRPNGRLKIASNTLRAVSSAWRSKHGSRLTCCIVDLRYTDRHGQLGKVPPARASLRVIDKDGSG